MQQGSLLPFLHEAARHVESIVGAGCADLVRTVRAMASYDFAMLAYGYHPRVSMHSAAMTAAELLCIADHLERAGQGPACESATKPWECDARTLEDDAGLLGAQLRQLTQEDVARALGHFRAAMQNVGIDLVMSLALEMKNARTLRAMAEARLAGAAH